MGRLIEPPATRSRRQQVADVLKAEAVRALDEWARGEGEIGAADVVTMPGILAGRLEYFTRMVLTPADQAPGRPGPAYIRPERPRPAPPAPPAPPAAAAQWAPWGPMMAQGGWGKR